MKYTSDDKKTLVKEVGYLSKDEHIEIFKIIKASTDQYTKNDNGIFINLSILDDKIFDKLYKFVNFCIDNRKTLEEKDEVFKLEKDKMFKNMEDDVEETNKDETVEEESNLDETETKDEEKSDNEEDTEEELEGAKISLKKTKPKYTGTKAKIIKNYKQSGNNIQNIIYKNSNSSDKKSSSEYNIGEENYEDYLEDNNDDYLENSTKNIDNEMDGDMYDVVEEDFDDSNNDDSEEDDEDGDE